MQSFDLVFLRQHSVEGVAEHLGAWACGRTGAAASSLWLSTGTGRLALVGAAGTELGRSELGFDRLPVLGPREAAPPPWRNKLAFAALPLLGSDGLAGVLVLGFLGSVPAHVLDDSELSARLAMAVAVLERNLMHKVARDAQSEAMARAGAGLAHTLGNVLQAAQSSVDHARTGADLNAVRASLSEASASLKRAAAVVRQLASLGGTGGERQPTEVGALIAGLVAALEPQMPSGVTLGIERLGGEAWAAIDPSVLEAAIAGLVYSAREQLGAQGSIRVSVRTTVAAQRWIEIDIRWVPADTPLVDRPTNPQIVAAVPFNDGGDTQGAGQLGLTMARAAVSRYGGSAERRTGLDVGGGTVVRLPALVAEPTSAVSTTMFRAVAHTLRVLIADDEPAVLRGLQRLLAAAGHTVHLARDGAEALALARATGQLDVALVDLTMPNLGGPPLVAALRRAVPHVPVVVMTGYASDEMASALRREGAAAVLKKPVASAALLEALIQAVQRQRQAAAGC